MSVTIIPQKTSALYNNKTLGSVVINPTIPTAIYNTVPVSALREETHFDTQVTMSSFPVDTEEFKEPDKEYSKQDAINKVIEWKRASTDTAISGTQRGLIPTYLDIVYHKTWQYFKDKKYAVLRSYTKIGISIDKINNSKNIHDKSIACYDLKMKEAVDNGYLQPFLVFLNGYQISWSRLRIVKSDDYFYIIISDIDCDTIVHSLKLLYIPFNIYYIENADERDDLNYIFRFTPEGLAVGDCTTFVYPVDKHIQTITLSEKAYGKYDVGIPYSVKLTPENFFFFNQDGTLKDDFIDGDIRIENGNILSVNNGAEQYIWGMCIYSTWSDANEANIVKALNEPFTKQLVQEIAGVTGLDEALFTESFEFTHSKKLPYATNINNSLNYIFDYDVNKFDSVYMEDRPVNIIELNSTVLGDRFSEKGYIEMQRDVYPGDRTFSYPIIFHNGMVPSYYDKIKYYGNKFSFIPYDDFYNRKGIDPNARFEVAYYRGVRNELIQLDKANSSDPEYLNIKSYYIPKDDIVIYAENDDKLYPLPRDISVDGYIKLHNTDFLKYQLYIGSRNQFIYERYNITETCTYINLSRKFRTGYDQQKYMVFVNGRYLNRIFYRTLIPSLTNDKIERLAIYLMKTLNPGDRVDVFYCSNPKQTPININGDLIIKCIKTKAYTDGQKRFKVPYPYTNYPHIYDAFFCIKHSTYVDKHKYIIDGDYIEFIDDDDELDFSRDLVFVFPYYMQDWDDEDNIAEDADLDFISRQTRVTENTTTVTFDPDYLGNIVNKDSVYIFFNTTFITGERYNLTSANTIEMIDETIPKDTNVTMVIETDATSILQNNVVLDTVEVVATEDKQYVFDIPETDYYDSFFVIKGTVLMTQERYFVSPDYKLFIINEDDYVVKGKKLIFIFAKDKNMEKDPEYKYKIKTNFMHTRCTETSKSMTIPTNYYHSFKFNKDNMLLFANSVFITTDRYTIKDNVITQTVDEDIIFRKGSSIDIGYAYTALNQLRFKGEANNKEIIYFQDKYADIYYDGQTKVEIPYPLLPLTDTEFIVSKGASILAPTMYSYTTGGKWLYLKDSANLQRGDKIRFTFVHNGGFTHIGKAVYTVRLSTGQVDVPIPSPYYKLLNLRNRMIVTFGNEYIDQSRYMVDNKNKILHLLDIPDYGNESGRIITFYFFYTGRESNGAIAYLPQSGYVCFLRKEVRSNFNKEMYMMFVNGRKVAKSDILDITNNMLKVRTDINRRYDVVILNASPTVTELKNKYTTKLDKWSRMIDPLPI